MELLGLDIGSSGCKATIIDEEGTIRAQASREYSTVSPSPGYEELDPNVVFAATCDVIRECVRKHRGDAIAAVSVSSFGEGFVPIDHRGNALHNVMMYIDPRGQDEAKRFEESFGFDRTLSITGVAIHSMYSLPKLLWIKENRRDLLDATWKILPVADYVLFKLGAPPHANYSLAARTMAFDVVNKKWSQEILDSVGIDIGKFAEPVLSGTAMDNIAPDVADALGLPRSVLLVAGGHDQPCAALGSGAIRGRLAVDGLGTTECVTPVFDRPVISQKMARCHFACGPHVKKDQYITYAFTFTGGGLLKWYRNNFSALYTAEAERSGKNIYTVIIESAAKAPSDLYLLPHFAGAATPIMDNSSKGMIVGLTLATEPKDIAKAILEGVTYDMMVNLEKLDEAGIAIDELRAVGGLAQSETYLQLKADMMGKKIVSLNVSEAGTLGVAMLAGTARGLYKSLDEAVERLVRVKRTFEPDSKLNEIYREKFETFKKLYPAQKTILSK